MKLSIYEQGFNTLCFVDLLSLKNPSLCEKLKNSKNINISCMQDTNLNASFYKCEIASVPFVLALLCKMSMDEFDDLDEGYLSAESCFGEEEALEVVDFLQTAKYIIFDENLKKHKDYENIKYFLTKLCEKFQLILVCSDEKEGSLNAPKEFSELLELDNFDGTIIMQAPLQNANLHCSLAFSLIAKIKNEDKIQLKLHGKNYETIVEVDPNLKGTVALYDYKCDEFAFVKAQIKVIK